MNPPEPSAGGRGDDGHGAKHAHRAGLRFLRTRLARGEKVTAEDFDAMIAYARKVLKDEGATERDQNAAARLILELDRTTVDVAKAVDAVDAPPESTVNHQVKLYEGFDPAKVGKGGG